MQGFLAILVSFPTVVFTIALGLAMIYWLMAILGAIDIEFLDATDGVVDGALDGMTEGALDAAIDGAFDGAVEGAVDGAMDGAVDGALEGADGVLDGADGAVDGADAAAAASQGGVMLLLANVLRLGRVPVTIALTTFTLWGWVVSFVITWALAGLLPETVPQVVFGATNFAVSLLVAAAGTNVSVRPLEPVFKTAKARTRHSLVGEVCTIRTGRVDSRFGQAEVTAGYDDLRIDVRCDSPNNGIGRGDKALIVHFDTEREAFVVEPLASADSTAARAGQRQTRAQREG